MKKILSIALIGCALLFPGCGLKEVLGPNVVADSYTNSDSYQPVSGGSKWVYNDVVIGLPDVKTVTIKGSTAVMDGRTYYIAVNTYKSDGSTTNTYFYHSGNVYTIRKDGNSPDDLLEMQYLDDTAIIGSTFISKPNALGTNNGNPTRWVGTIIDRNSTHVAGGQSFKNVIHTKLVLQIDYNDGKGYVNGTQVYDYYVAKGIGIVDVQFSNTTALTENQTLTSYNIN